MAQILAIEKKNLLKAIRLLDEKIVVKKVSSLYETKPVGYINQRNFYNCVLKAKTSLSPQRLLLFVKTIEKKMKRKKIIKNGPRTIDIDILFFGNKRIKTSKLTIPHPRLSNRDFVVIPLLEIGKKVKENKEKIKKTIIKKRNKILLQNLQ